jgi:hypothetical protein
MNKPIIELSLEPLIGVGPIKFGMSRIAARAELQKLGIPLSSSEESLDYFYENAIQIEYTEHDRASFIGIASHKTLFPTYYGQDVFSLTAKEFFNLVAEHETEDAHKFDSSEYLFRDQILTLWDADTQYDYRTQGKRQVWGQVGLGNLEYLALTDKIRGGI